MCITVGSLYSILYSSNNNDPIPTNNNDPNPPPPPPLFGEQIYQRLIDLEEVVHTFRQQIAHLTNENARVKNHFVPEVDALALSLSDKVTVLESTPLPEPPLIRNLVAPPGEKPRVSWAKDIEHQTKCAQCCNVLINGKGVSQMGSRFCSSGCRARHAQVSPSS